jgi:hypothetical protein
LLLISCGKDQNTPQNSGTPVTPQPEFLQNKVEISYEEIEAIMKSEEASNQAYNLGDQYIESEVYPKGYDGLSDCRINTLSSNTLTHHDQSTSEATVLIVEKTEYSGSECPQTETTYDRYTVVYGENSIQRSDVTGQMNGSSETNIDLIQNTQKEDFTFRYYKGSLNNQVYLFIELDAIYEGQKYTIKSLINPKRPTWAGAEKSVVLLDQAILSESESGPLTQVSQFPLDETNISDSTLSTAH